MCKRQPTTIAALLKATLKPQWLVDTARQEGLFVRVRKLEPYAFLWVLLLGWTSQRRPSISSLRRTYARRTGNDIAYLSFRDKLAHPACAFWLQTCLWHVIESTSKLIPKPNHPMFSALSNAVAIDSSLVHLHSSLAHKFPSTYPKRAALKLHAVYNVIYGTAMKLKISKGTLHDLKGLFHIGPWVEGRLLLFDLGYSSHKTFKAIAKHGGFFVSRLKSNAKVVIDEDNRDRTLGSMRLEGKSLWDVLKKIRRQELDIQATIGVGKKSFQARVVGIRNQETGRWHLYVTNINADQANAEFIVYLYRKRWQVEIVFKMLRSVGLAGPVDEQR